MEESLPTALARVELKCIIDTWGASVMEESMATGLGRVDLKCIISTSESLVMGESRATSLGRVEPSYFSAVKCGIEWTVPRHTKIAHAIPGLIW
jgi:hypothetical protein